MQVSGVGLRSWMRGSGVQLRAPEQSAKRTSVEREHIVRTNEDRPPHHGLVLCLTPDTEDLPPALSPTVLVLLLIGVALDAESDEAIDQVGIR